MQGRQAQAFLSEEGVQHDLMLFMPHVLIEADKLYSKKQGFSDRMRQTWKRDCEKAKNQAERIIVPLVDAVIRRNVAGRIANDAKDVANTFSLSHHPSGSLYTDLWAS